MSPTPIWYEADTDDADRHRVRDAIVRLDVRDDELTRLRDMKARVEALANRARAYCIGPRPFLFLSDLDAALADPAPVVQHDDATDGGAR